MINTIDEKIPNPKEIEREIGEFLHKRFGGAIKIVTPTVAAQETAMGHAPSADIPAQKINFDIKPEELIAYLDQYIIKQDKAKAVLSTKICTHFNRIKHLKLNDTAQPNFVGNVKSNILMLGPTGVGKTYMVKLIAKKIGVPFVKADATKFTETGYVGGDVEDLIRDLVREANDDIELAQYGIIYLDEIDKIASSHHIVGADISRTGVQRALLKPMEETDVELRVPHDPISMIQEIERYQKTGKRDKRIVNTAHILFIMSGAFEGITDIIKKRVTKQPIGFGSMISSNTQDKYQFLKQVRTEDLVEFGFESEFIGRLPVKTVFEKLTEDDFFEILISPNNPLILGKKLDFAAYSIDIKFDDPVLRYFAEKAFKENTGARGLVSVIEESLLLFEKRLPSLDISVFPATLAIITDSEKQLLAIENQETKELWESEFQKILEIEKDRIRSYVKAHWDRLTSKYALSHSDNRIELIADYYSRNITDIEQAVAKIKIYYGEVKKIEKYFLNTHELSLLFDEDAIDFLIEQFVHHDIELEDIVHKLETDFEYGLKLIRDKTGKNRFFISRESLIDSNAYLNRLIKEEYQAIA
ncbi:MAG: AAA family ATPase [Desulfobacterales bacterium]|nr:AAA family ATPase [Desulfobacterales bacterium]